MKSTPLGDRAWRFPRPPGISARALTDALRAEPEVIDVVVTEDHVASYFAAPHPPPDLDAAVARARANDGATKLRTHVIGVAYEGEDLAPTAARLGIDVPTLVSLHTARSYEVRLIGFLPGFAYLGDLDPKLVLPRRDSPRPRVPAASVAIAGSYTAIYPFVSPGGWHLLGRALDFTPLTFALGDHVRFEAR